MSFPTGIIANVERQESHREFVQAVKPEYVIMRITHARRLIDDGLTFDEYYPESVDVITTTTVPDNQLELIAREREDDELIKYSEIDIIEAVEPDYHIPADYPLYVTMSEAEQLQAVQQCVSGTEWMYEQVSDTDITIIPLIKGLTKEQRQVFYDMYDELGMDYAAFYATQYFTTDTGVTEGELISDIERIVVERPSIELFTMGVLSSQLLRKLPKNVVAASGQKQWRTKTGFRNGTTEEMKTGWEELENEVNKALGFNPNNPKE